MRAVLMLENGNTYEGMGFGDMRDVMSEVVFNTAMCGYTELLTDPSYAGQAVVMTYPLVGNYGVCYEDMESDRPWLDALIVRSVSEMASNFRCDITLDGYLKNNHIPGICGIDTRALARCLRDNGTMKGIICYGESANFDEMKKKLEGFTPDCSVCRVSAPESKVYGTGDKKVALIDYGVKQDIIRGLTRRGCTVKCFPHDVELETILEYNPDGIMLSNGPGDPKACVKEIEVLKKVYDSGIPVFAIGLGHQLLALAKGADTCRLKFGHHGCNHPVKEMKTGHVYISSHNHGYAVDANTVDESVAKVSFLSLNDNSVEGLEYSSGKVISVQFYPDSSASQIDTGFLFDRFMNMIGGCNE